MVSIQEVGFDRLGPRLRGRVPGLQVECKKNRKGAARCPAIKSLKGEVKNGPRREKYSSPFSLKKILRVVKHQRSRGSANHNRKETEEGAREALGRSMEKRRPKQIFSLTADGGNLGNALRFGFPVRWERRRNDGSRRKNQEDAERLQDLL